MDLYALQITYGLDANGWYIVEVPTGTDLDNWLAESAFEDVTRAVGGIDREALALEIARQGGILMDATEVHSWYGHYLD